MHIMTFFQMPGPLSILAKMPAEWRPHSRTIMALPGMASHSYWPPGNFDQMHSDVVRVARATARFEPVTLYVAKSQFFETKNALKTANSAIDVRVAESDDMKPWMRDIAPTFIVGRDSSVHGVDFHFNGWGGKDKSGSNRCLARMILDDLQILLCETSLVAEGGAIEVDSQGTLLATESSLINANRNPAMDRADIERELKRVLGASKIIWLPGVSGEDMTDCHVDALARFIQPGIVVLSRPPTTRPAIWTEAYKSARRVLEMAEDAQGRCLKVVDICEPDVSAVEEPDPEMIPSYVNYFHVKGAVIVPQFGFAETDAEALRILGELFHNKELVPVQLRGLPNAGGGLHCITQQIPVAEWPPSRMEEED